MPLSPIGLTLAAAALLLNGNCGARPPATSSQTSDDVVTAVSQSFTRLASRSTSGFTEPLELVVRDAAAFAAAWKTLNQGLPGNPPPAIDLGRSIVVVVALGARSTGGYAVHVDSVERTGGALIVRYTATSPGRECMTTQSLSAPVELIRVDHTAGTVRFERAEAVRPC